MSAYCLPTAVLYPYAWLLRLAESEHVDVAEKRVVVVLLLLLLLLCLVRQHQLLLSQRCPWQHSHRAVHSHRLQQTRPHRAS